MDGLILGIDLCDEYTQIACAEEEQSWTIPTVICKHKEKEQWYVGEEAYAHTLQGDGIIVDKLVKLVVKDGTATLGERRYSGSELMELFLRQAVEFPRTAFEMQEIRQLVFTVRKLEPRLIEALRRCGEALGIERENIYMISHPESMIYYALSQRKDIWSGTVGLFSLTQERLRYYELRVQRGAKHPTVAAEYEELEESFNLDILKSPSGARLADRILCSCGTRLMEGKLYSAVFLTGKGFLNRDWAEEFMKLICTKRRVYLEETLFARGAAVKAADLLKETTAYPFIMLCEGRLKSTISMNVVKKGQDVSLILAAAGEGWYDRVTTVEVIPEGKPVIELLVTPPDEKKSKQVRIPLEGFPDRLDRTTRVQVRISFLDEKTMDVTIRDQGFGELFPSSGMQIRQEVML